MGTVKLRTRGTLGSPLMVGGNVFIFTEVEEYLGAKVLLYDLTNDIELGIVKTVQEVQDIIHSGYTGAIRVLSEIDIISNNGDCQRISGILNFVDNSYCKALIDSSEDYDIVAYDFKM